MARTGKPVAEPLPFRNFVAQSRLETSRAEHRAFFQELLGDITEPTAPFGLVDVRNSWTHIDESQRLVDEVFRVGYADVRACSA